MDKPAKDSALVPRAAGKQTDQRDFDRNRDGLYGGLPKTRDANAPGPKPKTPHPEKK
jgi:hypothetical protein